MSIRNSHPNLFTGYLMNGTINLLIGLFSLFSTELTFFSYVFIAMFIALALLTYLFTLRYSQMAIRIVLVSGLFFNSFFVFLFLISMFLSFDEMRDTAYVIPLFAGHAMATYLLAVEPPTNPATAREEDE